MSRACPECAPEICLRHLSPELHEYLIDLQAEYRKSGGKVVSLERVIARVISDHKSLKEQGKFLLTLTNETEEPKTEEQGSN